MSPAASLILCQASHLPHCMKTVPLSHAMGFTIRDVLPPESARRLLHVINRSKDSRLHHTDIGLPKLRHPPANAIFAGHTVQVMDRAYHTYCM
jgi:hypothetical protein